MARGDPTFELACQRKTETENAVLVYDFVKDEQHWIPLSQVESMHFDKEGNGRIVMTEWIAKKKGFI